MRRVISAAVFAVLCSGVLGGSAAADDVSTSKKIASLSDFGAKLDTLEQAVDDLTITGALALLKSEYPSWEFDATSGFEGSGTAVSNDLGALAASHEYGLGKLRGAIFRNKDVSDDQRALALQVLDDVKALMLVGYELDGLIGAGELNAAGQVYRDRILTQSDKLNSDIDQLTKEIDQAIKFSSL